MHKLLNDYLFVERRKLAYLLSIALIVAGLAVGFVRGFHMGIDFTGGTMIQLQMGQKVDQKELEGFISDHGVKGNVTSAGEDGHSVIIKTTVAMDTDSRMELIDAIRDE